MSGTKAAAAVWDEVQGACDASRLTQALNAAGGAPLVLDGWTPLHFASENRAASDANRAAAIRVLTARGVDANAVDENGWTALHLLSKNKHADAIDASLSALLTGGADATRVTSNSKKTALHLLCENESVTVAALSTLVTATRGGVDATDADGNVPLHYLTENTALTPALLTILLTAKANPNIQNTFCSTPFHSLCQHSALSVPLVQAMLTHKANPNLPNNIGHTPFHYACENYALTTDVLHAFVTSKQVNVTTTNALGKTALDLIPPHKHDCLAVAQKLGVPSLGAAALSASSAKDAATPGGEDPAELASVAPSLAPQLAAWNASLPPFDMAFYNAVCCEPAFSAAYEHVQDVSAQVNEAPSDRALLQAWMAALATWRTQLLLAFTALVSPELWDSYADKYNRVVPRDVASVRAAVTAVWTQFPGPTHRRERFDALASTFSTP